MILNRFYSTITKKTYDYWDDAREEEIDWSLNVLHNSTNFIARGSINEEMLDIIDGDQLALEVYLFVPLTEEAVEAFKFLVDYDGYHIDNTDNFKVRTPVKWDEGEKCWKLLPDLVKYAHKIYTELTDQMAEVENAINTKFTN